VLPGPRSKAEQAAVISSSKAARSLLALVTWSVAMSGSQVLCKAVTGVVSIGGTLPV